jgi:hypothetical protein
LPVGNHQVRYKNAGNAPIANLPPAAPSRNLLQLDCAVRQKLARCRTWSFYGDLVPSGVHQTGKSGSNTRFQGDRCLTLTANYQMAVTRISEDTRRCAFLALSYHLETLSEVREAPQTALPPAEAPLVDVGTIGSQWKVLVGCRTMTLTPWRPTSVWWSP